MWDVIDEELAKKQGKEKGEVIKHYVKELTALGRTSVPEDVAKLVGFQAGPDSDFVTGRSCLVLLRLLTICSRQKYANGYLS